MRKKNYLPFSLRVGHRVVQRPDEVLPVENKLTVIFTNMARVSKIIKQYKQLWILCLCLLPGISCEYLTFRRCGETKDSAIYVCPAPLHTPVCGDSLTTLCCEVHEEGTADEITISYFTEMDINRLVEYIVPSVKINNITRKVTVNLTKVGSYKYKCNTKYKKPSIKIVNVIEPPSKVTDFKCRSDNLETLKCTWSRPKNDYITKYKIFDFLNGSPRKNASIHYMGEKVYAVWTESTQPLYRNEEAKITFNLTSSNPFGEINQTFSIDHHSLVKLKPVSKLAVLNITSRTATLEWQLDAKVMFLEGVNFKIEIQSLLNNKSYTEYQSYTIQKDLSFLKKKNTFNLSSLTAHSHYNVNVSVKPWNASSDFWSDPSRISFLTKSERPERPPVIPAGAFTSRKYNNQRIVNVYWKLLEEYEKVGEEFDYIVHVIESSKISKYSTKSGSFELTNKPIGAIEILVSSNNEVGSSNSSSLYVPAVVNSKLNVDSFTVVSYRNGTYDMMWLNKHSVDNYTVFWCKYDVIFCINGIDFVQVDGKRQEHRIELPRKNHSYQLAIAANKGQMSSGITMNKECDHFSEDFLAKSNFPVTIDVENYTDSSVDLKWSLKCLYKKGIVTGYNITSSYVNLNGECSYNKFAPSPVYISDPTKNKISIKGLHPYTEYKFEVGVDTTFRSRAGTASINIVTKQGTPEKPKNLHINKVTNNSVTIYLEPPLRLNGPTKNLRFIVYNNNTETIVYNKTPNCTCLKCENIIVKNLQPFTDHQLSVKSYNAEINSYSDATNTMYVKTKIGKPDNITAWYSSSNSTLIWDRPLLRGVPDHYEVKIKLNCNSCGDKNISKINETYFIDDVTGCNQRTYYVRAVNKDETGVLYLGDWGTGYNVSCENNFLFIVYIVFGPMLVLVSLWLAYKGLATLKVRMRVDPPKFHPSIDINIFKNDRVLESISKIENYGLIEDKSKAKVQPNHCITNNLNYLEVIPFLTKEKTTDFDLRSSENQTVPHITSVPRTTQSNIHSENDNDSPIDLANKQNNNSQNSLAYQNSRPLNLPTGYVQAFPTTNITSDKSEHNNVPNTLPGCRDYHFLEDFLDNNKEMRKQPSTSNMPSAYVRASSDVLTSAIHPKLHNLLTNDNDNDQIEEAKFPSGYVKALPMISTALNPKSNNLSTSEMSNVPSFSKISSGYEEVLPMISSTSNPKSHNLSPSEISNDPSSSEICSGYVKATPEHLCSVGSKSKPILTSIATNDDTVEPSHSQLTSGYVKALPLPRENINFISSQNPPRDAIVVDEMHKLL